MARPRGVNLDQVIKQKRAKQVMFNIDQMPSLPGVVRRVMALANDPNSSAKDFEKFIGRDQTLTAKLLKLANSSFYGLNTKLNTIQRAIVVLGYKTLKSVVMAASTSNLLDREMKLYGYSKRGLWLHSIACAGIAHHLASKTFRLGIELAEEAFVTGLLHDIGKIPIAAVLVEDIPGFASFMRANRGCGVVEMERALAGIDHAEAGRAMMQKWKLSDTLANGIAEHHQQSARSDEPEAQFAAMIALADCLCLELRLGLSPNYPYPTRTPIALIESLDLEPADYVMLLDQVKEMKPDLEALFSSLAD